MKVYVICDGSYSGYHVCGAASTKEKAEAAIKSGVGSCYDEYDVDDFLEGVEIRDTWRCKISKDGVVGTAKKSDRVLVAIGKRSDVRAVGKHGWSVVSYVSAHHAKKVAIEKWQDWLRTKAMEAGITK